MTTFVIAGAFGPWQFILIVAVIILFFGGKKIPELMKGLGKGVGEFKKGMREAEEELSEKDDTSKKQ
jgi:sec-independent protein translocase protein TatA